MSTWVKVELNITDQKCLVKALEQLDCKINENSVKSISAKKYGINGNANVICTNKQNKVIGFLKNKKGSYEAIHYDVSDSFFNQVIQHHGVFKSIQETKRMGYTVMSKKTNTQGDIEIEVMLA